MALPRMHEKPMRRHTKHATTPFTFEVVSQEDSREVHIVITRETDGATQWLIFGTKDARALARWLGIACARIGG